MCRLITCWLLIIFSGVSAVHAQSVCKYILPGIIVGYDPPSADYSLIRQGKELQIGMYTRLLSGDVLRINSATVSLKIGDSQEHTAIYPATDSPLCVKAGPAVTWWTNAIGMVGIQLTKERDQASQSLATRGPAPDLALDMGSLQSGKAVVGAGSRAFGLSWHGGLGPYRVQVVGADKKPVVDESDIDGYLLIKRKPVDLSRGRYKIMLTDARGVVATGSFLASDPVFPSSSGAAQKYNSDSARIGEVAAVLTSYPDRNTMCFYG